MPEELKPSKEKKGLGDQRGYSYNEDDLAFSPLQVDFNLLDIVQKQGNPLGMRIGNNPDDYFQVEKDGTIEFNGDATVWDDLRVPVTSVKPGNTQPGFGLFIESGLKTYLFDGGGRAEEVHFACQLPHGYKIGTDIVPHVHWSPTTIDIGNVRWSLQYSWADDGATFGASTTIHVVGATTGTPYQHIRTDFAAIDGSGITGVSSMLICRLYRDSTADTYLSDAALLEFDFHYEIDTVGSRQILIK